MVRRAGCHFVKRKCALALAFSIVVALVHLVSAQDMLFDGPGSAPSAPLDLDANPYAVPAGPPLVQSPPPSQAWISPPGAQPLTTYPAPCNADPAWGEPVVGPCQGDPWRWQILPKSVIYHSYWAGVHEPRLGIVAESETNAGALFWDGTLGGRAGVLRYGTGDGIMPQGWELDVEAAAMVRLTLDEIRDFETADYRVGVPLTYGQDNIQYKFAIYHLSSHLGDEFAIAHPGSLATRINYVRDALVYGTSIYLTPELRSYFEISWAFNSDGGAEPWEIQFGNEWSAAGPTGPHGSPFAAYNVHLRKKSIGAAISPSKPAGCGVTTRTKSCGSASIISTVSRASTRRSTNSNSKSVSASGTISNVFTPFPAGRGPG